jgi:hypothetical protein
MYSPVSAADLQRWWPIVDGGQEVRTFGGITRWRADIFHAVYDLGRFTRKPRRTNSGTGLAHRQQLKWRGEVSAGAGCVADLMRMIVLPPR